MVGQCSWWRACPPNLCRRHQGPKSIWAGLDAYCLPLMHVPVQNWRFDLHCVGYHCLVWYGVGFTGSDGALCASHRVCVAPLCLLPCTQRKHSVHDFVFPQSTVQLECTIWCRPSSGHGVPITRGIYRSCYHYSHSWCVAHINCKVISVEGNILRRTTTYSVQHAHTLSGVPLGGSGQDSPAQGGRPVEILDPNRV